MLDLMFDYLTLNKGYLRDALLRRCEHCKDGRMRKKEVRPSTVVWSKGFAILVCDRCNKQKIIDR